MDDSKQFLEVGIALPARSGNTVSKPSRGTPYGDQIVYPIGKPKYGLVDEGSYFVTTNPTPGTGIAGIAATGAFSDTESLLYIKNGSSAEAGKRIFLDYIRLTVTAAGSNDADHRFAIKTEQAGVERYTSGGSALTPVNPNSNSSAAAAASVKFGALVTTAVGTGVRLVSHGLLRKVIAVVGDQYVFDFGGDVAVSSMINAGTAVAHIHRSCPGIVIGPGETLVMSLFATAQDAAMTSYELEMGHWER